MSLKSSLQAIPALLVLILVVLLAMFGWWLIFQFFKIFAALAF